MMVVAVYDIPEKAGGKKRRKKIADLCASWGCAVQHSVYECVINEEQFQRFKAALRSIIIPETDSVRLYRLGKHYSSRVEYLGKKAVRWDQETFVL